ncbi:MAG TPA: hypothetical protein VLB01_03435 [Thermodesulfobacteriota bacterium]|nr:hypothetical protein [Thermodesulfobacteriota bacterium]
MTDTLPLGATFISSTTSQGSCTGTATVKCKLGTINTGKSATVKICIKITQVVNKVNIKSNMADPVSSNNNDTEVTNLQ